MSDRRWTIRWQPWEDGKPGGWIIDGGPPWPEDGAVVMPVPDDAAVERVSRMLWLMFGEDVPMNPHYFKGEARKVIAALTSPDRWTMPEEGS